MKKVNNILSFKDWWKRRKRIIGLASFATLTTAVGGGVGIGYSIWNGSKGHHIIKPVPKPIPVPTPILPEPVVTTTINYAPWEEVANFFSTTSELSFKDNNKIYDTQLNDYMKAHPQYNGIDFGNRYTSVAKNAFINSISMNYESKLIAIKFDRIETVNDYAFKNCYGLEEVRLGNGDNIVLKQSSFMNCDSLCIFEVDKTAHFKNIDANVFQYCSNLINRDQFRISDDNLKRKNDNVSIGHWIGEGKNAWIYNDNPDKRSIDSECLGSIAFGKIDISSIKDFTKEHFYGCHSIRGVIFPKIQTNPQRIYSSFVDCINLRYAELPTWINGTIHTFDNCTNLTNIAFQDITNSSMTDLTNTFGRCHNIKELVLPNTVSEISDAFRDCSNLNTIKFTKSTQGTKKLQISLSSFVGCTRLTQIDLFDKDEGFISPTTTPLNLPFKGVVTGLASSDNTFIKEFMSYLPKDWTYQQIQSA